MADFTVAMVDYDYDSLAMIEGAVRDLGGDFIHRQCETIDEAIEWGGHADGWIVQYLNPVDAKVFEACPSIKVVGRTGIGVDPIIVPDATAHGVVVCNVPDYCFDEVSDHALALMLTCLRKTSLHSKAVKNGTWDWIVGRPIPRLNTLTLGLVAFGQIPRTLAPKARALGMKILCADPYLQADVAEAAGVELVDFDTLLAQSDVISIHCPLTEETTGLFNADAFAKMKDTAYLINTGRGPIIDTAALAVALKAGQVAGAGLDVMPQEPPAADDPLLAMDNVILTPHIGWYSEDSIIQLHRDVGTHVAHVCMGKEPKAVVNRDVLEKLDLK